MTVFEHLKVINVKASANLKKLYDYYETTHELYNTFDESVKKLGLDIDPTDRSIILFNLSHRYIMREAANGDYHMIMRTGMNNLDLKVVDIYSRIVFKMKTSNNDNVEDRYIEFMGAKFNERNSCHENLANIPDYYIDYDVDPIDEICNKLKDQFISYFSIIGKKCNIRVIAIKKNREVLFTVLIDE